jgi:hypothetical protein
MSVLYACPKNDVALVMGDGLHDSTNENGLRLIDFAAGRQMAIKSIYFMHKRINLDNWHSPDGRTRN